MSERITVGGSRTSPHCVRLRFHILKHIYPSTQHPYPEDSSLGIVAGQKAGGEGASDSC
jgi:hypothetical protein